PSQYIKEHRVYMSPADFTTVEGMTPVHAAGGTEALITGLMDGLTYYFAVTTVNISDGEPREVATATATPGSRLIARWTMDNLEGLLLNNETGVFHGEINGDAVQAPGCMDHSLDFDGQDDFVSLDSLADYLVSGEDVTLSMWFNTAAEEADDHRNILFSANGPNGSNLFRLGAGNAGGIYYAPGAD
ncbi:MAG: hypothetical protein GY859_38150, partial [Desulfobacterales bacterium]|nr:hypothetical protein [Desulfobacterales bacterium]